MLAIWRSHAEYQLFLINNLLSLYTQSKTSLNFYSEALSKLYILDSDVIKPLIQPCFSNTGNPSNQHPEIFRSFILMSELGYHSIPNWIAFFRATPILCYAIGVSPDDVPDVGSYYDFINMKKIFYSIRNTNELLCNFNKSIHFKIFI
ncbi:hypothetical protein [Clostridium kluyveri]|uniref:Uncharacterized protein n=1 Tax=Clostridium kluyveri TaxID=1534 RepID=A0A1L5FCY4_CLOKL|nr:hypothetical protein [Clostridium kluyveri]APM40803.1 hypothetical protein BS101_19860 [Clostridium kluyveri]